MPTVSRSIRVFLVAALAATAVQSQDTATGQEERGEVVAELRGIRLALERQARRYEADLALRRLELAMQRLAPVREERRRIKEQVLSAGSELQSVIDELQFLQRRQRETDVPEEQRAHLQISIDQLQVSSLRLRRRDEHLQRQLVDLEAEYSELKGAVEELEKAADRALNLQARP